MSAELVVSARPPCAEPDELADYAPPPALGGHLPPPPGPGADGRCARPGRPRLGGVPGRRRRSGAPLPPLPERRPAPATYLVQPGDTLWSIARQLQPSGDVRPLVRKLVQLNDGAELEVGQVLVLP